jgi:hypothetical protein
MANAQKTVPKKATSSCLVGWLPDFSSWRHSRWISWKNRGFSRSTQYGVPCSSDTPDACRQRRSSCIQQHVLRTHTWYIIRSHLCEDLATVRQETTGMIPMLGNEYSNPALKRDYAKAALFLRPLAQRKSKLLQNSYDKLRLLCLSQ